MNERNHWIYLGFLSLILKIVIQRVLKNGKLESIHKHVICLYLEREREMGKTMQRLRSERFEVSYNKIHLELKRLVKNEAPHFQNLVFKGAKRFSVIKTYQEELHQFARLRNAIVHNKYDIGEYIAEPHEKTVEQIEEICRIFTKPNDALTIATKQVIVYDYHAPIAKVIQGVHKHNYSQYPIYNGDICIGLLTAKAIVRWVAKRAAEGKYNHEHIQVKEIFDMDEDHPIEFVSRSANIFDVEEIFAAAHMKKQDLEAIVITETGERNLLPIGVITPWDLIEIDFLNE